MLEAAMAVAARAEHGRLFEIVLDRLTRHRPGRWLFDDPGSRGGVEELETFRAEFAALARERLGVVGAAARLLEHFAREAAARGRLEVVTAGGEPGLAVLGAGWSDPESGGVWSDGTSAVLTLPLPDESQWTVTAHASPYPLGPPDRTVTVRESGVTLASASVRPDGGSEPLRFTVPGGRRVTLDMPWATAPADLGGGPDRRRLGICLHRLEIERAEAPGS